MRREILLGILYCDLIGFHTYDYARHFLSSCTRILSLPTMPNGVEFEGRLAHVGTFPIGIEPASFIDARHVPPYSVLHWLISSQTESTKTACQRSHITAGTTFWRRESHCWCWPFGLHQGSSSETSCIGAFSLTTPGMDWEGLLRERMPDDFNDWQRLVSRLFLFS